MLAMIRNEQDCISICSVGEEEQQRDAALQQVRYYWAERYNSEFITPHPHFAEGPQLCLGSDTAWRHVFGDGLVQVL